MSFKNKVALITGASAGIGAATAIQFAKEGAKVAIAGRNEARLKEVALKCEKLGSTALIIRADVAKDEEAKAIVKKTVETFGKLDILVNNAGVLRHTSLKNSDAIKVYDEVMSVNVRAVVHLISLAAPHLAQTKGNIVNITSVLGETYAQLPEVMMYCTSKAALNHFTRGAALELAASGIRVNLVSPGPVRTEMLANLVAIKNTPEDNPEFTPLNRISEPEEIADVIMFLASDKAKGVTGSNYRVDNGVLLNF